jgi:hypothetical protein
MEFKEWRRLLVNLAMKRLEDGWKEDLSVWAFPAPLSLSMSFREWTNWTDSIAHTSPG